MANVQNLEVFHILNLVKYRAFVQKTTDLGEDSDLFEGLPRFCNLELNCGFTFQLLSNGTDGCQLVSGDSDGIRPRANVLSSIPNVVWHQAPSLCWNYSQGKNTYSRIIIKMLLEK